MKYSKTYFWFVFTAVIIFIIGMFYKTSEDVIVLNNHDTYFVISNFDASIIFASIFALIGFIYWILSKTSLKLNTLLSKIHSIASISCVIMFSIGIFYYNKIKTENEFPLFNDTIDNHSFITLSFIIFSFIQMLFITNLCTSILAHFYFNNRTKKL
ncbi:hypothetical protein ACFSKN_17645 [Mariniflexile gromovii]|uniref:Uncharacterized protein n=1 Tax=Mariniflexile gromovii TaxID=362523 RepID=A0ABS4BXK2_9FLAO|nr:hypothetical protein [Mariniflexile gromovii]MBP0905316.1 hypothetical protein [Mariniflexile gromovii]